MLWISSKEEGRSTKESTRSEKGLEMGVEESLGGGLFGGMQNWGCLDWQLGLMEQKGGCIILERGGIESSEFGPMMGGAQIIQRNR